VNKQPLFKRMADIGAALSLSIAYLFIVCAVAAMFGGSFK
jgi:hypothetical protein